MKKGVRWLIYSDLKLGTVKQLINMSLVQTVAFDDADQKITFYYAGGSSDMKMKDLDKYKENKEKIINF